MLSRVVDNIFCCNMDNRNMLREITVKIGLKRIDTQKGVMVEVLIERQIYMRNVDGTFNKERPIENTMKVNIYY